MVKPSEGPVQGVSVSEPANAALAAGAVDTAKIIPANIPAPIQAIPGIADSPLLAENGGNDEPSMAGNAVASTEDLNDWRPVGDFVWGTVTKTIPAQAQAARKTAQTAAWWICGISLFQKKRLTK